MEEYKDRLLQYLLGVCTSGGWLDGVLLETPDLDEAWLRYAPSFYGDAVRNFNAWPEFCLGCAGYLGMAVAALWDRDWERYKSVPYSYFLGKRGFDDMDDHIAESILFETKESRSAMQACALQAWDFLQRQASEPGTAEAYRLFLATVEVMYKIGAAVELHRQGYKFEKV